jgi:signal transduction histidine kinase
MRGLATTISTLRWLRILLAGAVVALLTLTFIYLAIYAYVVFYPVSGQADVESEHLGKVADFVSGWGARLFFLAATALVASWVARRADDLAIVDGVLTGLLAATVLQMLVLFFYPPVRPSELLIYVGLGVAGGWLGGVEGRSPLAAGVYRASREIGRAGDPASVVAAIGEHLSESGAHSVSLWRAASGKDGSGGATADEMAQSFVPWVSWPASAEDAWSPGARLEVSEVPVLSHLAGRSSMVLPIKELPPAARPTAWERQGVRQVLVAQLVAPGDKQVGLLTVMFRKRRRLSKGTVRAYSTVGAQAALAVETWFLLEEAGRAGRRAGILIERLRLAHEIHDTLAQGLASIVMNLSTDMEHPAAAPGTGPARQHLEEARRTAHELLAETRRLVWALRPESLDRHSLSEALNEIAASWSRETGVEAHVVTAGVPHTLLPEAQVALLRTAQEALANVRKHARASKVNITLSYMDDRVVLDVLDDGVGFESARAKTALGAQDAGGFGLIAMRERIELLGGTLLVESVPGGGATLVAELPVSTHGLEARAPEAWGSVSLRRAP